MQDADGKGRDDRTGHAGQAGGDDHREGLQDQQGESVRGELQPRCQQDAGEPGEGGTDGPAGSRDPVGRNRGKLGELAVVHHRLDLPTETGAVRDDPEGHAHGDDQAQFGERVHTDAVVTRQHDRAGWEQTRRVSAGTQPPDPSGHSDGQDQHAQTRHQGFGGGGAPAGERAEDEPFEQQTDHR